MRSIVEEASTIQKAVDTAWSKAGKPSEFTVKILELPQYSFFGLTKRSAKIALFFTPKTKKVESSRDNKNQLSRAPQKRQPRGVPLRKKQPLEATSNKREPVDGQWKPQMITAANDWIESILKIVESKEATFSCQAKQRVLFISFTKPLLKNRNQDQRLLMSLSHLILKFLRLQFKEETRHLRIVLQVAQ